MTQDFEIKGSKGGEKKQYQPVESPDSLRSLSRAKILIALGEGEFEGVPTARDIYFDGTPLADSNGNLNFPNVRWEYRSGSQDQDYIKGMPSAENEFGLNYNLTQSQPYIRAINNTQLSAVRVRFRWPALQQQQSNGDLTGSSVNYAVDVSTDGGPYVEMLNESVTGKTTTGYERSRRVDLPTALTGWQLRVRRITPDSTTATVQNSMLVTAVTEVIDAKLRYPNTALLFVEFDATQFQNIPKISCNIRGRAWPVPANYDPETRTYSGIWDGTFKSAWTDNPVWIGYGILLHERFGLGKRIKANNIDKWELYRISQYCDDLVPNGAGGLEPRFTCNMYIQGRAEAWSVLRDIAAIYRGMVYWSQSQMTSIADMPRDIDYNFSRSNVIDGKFSYSGSSERSVYSRAIVAYDDPSNNYNSDTTATYDLALQRRYGDNLLEITAIGCTSQSEAQRRGKWALYTNANNRGVTFQVGLDGNIPMPGYVIGIADQLLSGRPSGGRISSVTSNRNVILDRPSQAKIGDLLTVNLPSGVSQSRTINAVAEEGKVIGVAVAFTELPESQAQWSVEYSDLKVQQFRVTKIRKDEPHLITIEAVAHDPNKFAQVDSGARREDRPITVIPPSVQAPPTNVKITANTMIEQTMAVTTMTISWDAPLNATYYVVEWRKDDKEWIRMARTGATSVDITGVYSGQYIARVRAYNAIDVQSVPATSVLTDIVGKAGNPPSVVNFRTTSKVFGIQLDWNFPVGALDTNYTEIQYNTTPNANGQELLLGTFAYPLNTYTQIGLGAGVVFHYRARLVDKTGNIGPWTTWLRGQSSDQANEILDYLTGKITETELGQELLTEIDKIPEIEQSLSELQNQVDNITDALDYDPSRTYAVGESVRVGNRLYQARVAVPVNTTPPNATYWIDVGSIVSGYGALSTQVNTNTASITSIDGRVTANSSSITGLNSRVTTAEGNITGQANALSGLTTRVTTAEGSISTQAQQITNLTSTVQGKADSSAVTALTTRVTTAEGTITSQSQQITQLGSSVGNADAKAQQALNTSASLSGDLSAMWSVKLQLNSNGQYVMAGVGLGIQNGPGGLQSNFIVRADQFSILNNQPSGQVTSPFIVSGGTTYISSAFIQNGSVDFLKISDTVQSTNYVSGQTGWRLGKNGVLEFNGQVSGGGRMTINNQLLSVYDQNGTLRVRLGVWA